MLNFLPQVRDDGLLVESGHRGGLVHIAHLKQHKGMIQVGLMSGEFTHRSKI